MRWIISASVLVLAGCGQPAQDAPPASGAAARPLAALNPREALLDCAGAIAAHAGLDPLADPSLDTPEENAYFTVLALMDKEPGLKGAAGRQAAAVSRDAWLEGSAEQRAARAEECRARFGA